MVECCEQCQRIWESDCGVFQRWTCFSQSKPPSSRYNWLKTSFCLFLSPNASFFCPGLLSSLPFSFSISVKSTHGPIGQESHNVLGMGEVVPSCGLCQLIFLSCIWFRRMSSTHKLFKSPLTSLFSAILHSWMCVCLPDLSPKCLFPTGHGVSPFDFFQTSPRIQLISTVYIIKPPSLKGHFNSNII